MSGPAMSPELGPGPPLGGPGMVIPPTVGHPPSLHHPGHPGYVPLGHEDRERNGAPEPREQDGKQQSVSAFNQFQQNQLRAQIQVYR